MGAIGAAILAVVGFSTLAAARGDPAAPDVAVVVFGIATLGWTMLPILGFGNDETLDPQRLATLPADPAPARDGVLACLARRRRAARDGGRVQRCVRRAQRTASPRRVVIVVAVPVTLLVCVIASRTLVGGARTGSALASRPRLHDPRGDALGLPPPLARDSSWRAGAKGTTSTRRSRGSRTVCASRRSRGVERRSPTRPRGHMLAAIGFLAADCALMAVLLVIWSRALERALPAPTRPLPHRGRRGPARAAGLIPRSLVVPAA